ncbi:MAG: uridine kinase [candidate division KSB1 bacterium]|nr:uridine kinase [candidate division KSB1 bacterium]
MNNEQSIKIIGIAGSSGSGKSFFARVLSSAFPEHNVIILSQDHYYKDLSEVPEQERQALNFDQPEAVDFELLGTHLYALKNGEPVYQPLYDFAHHNRLSETRYVEPKDIIILDGILVLSVSSIRDLCDIKVYVDTPLDLCFIRRLQRDIVERGRTVDSVIQQYCKSVRPMFLEYVQPCRDHADVVVKGQGDMLADRERILELMNPVCMDNKA